MLSLQKKIFENMAWHAVAYEQCGIDEIRRLHGQGHLTDQLLAGWEDVEAEKGKESGLKMLSHEQTFVQEDFDDDAPDALIIVLNVFASPPASMLGGDPTPKSFNAYHLAEETDDPSFDDLDDRLGWESHLLEVFVQQEEGDE